MHKSKFEHQVYSLHLVEYGLRVYAGDLEVAPFNI